MYSLCSGPKRVETQENEGSLVLQQLVIVSSCQNLHVSFHGIESLQLNVLLDFRCPNSLPLTIQHLKLYNLNMFSVCLHLARLPVQSREMP